MKIDGFGRRWTSELLRIHSVCPDSRVRGRRPRRRGFVSKLNFRDLRLELERELMSTRGSD